jgi:hypothetical protein
MKKFEKFQGISAIVGSAARKWHETVQKSFTIFLIAAQAINTPARAIYIRKIAI